MNIDVFISHHTNSSLHIVEGIVNKLEANGIKCWYAPRDTAGDYAGSIADAIEECRVFLLVLNKAASESPHVLNELNLVTERLAAGNEVDIIPFHTADTDISNKARYYIGRMHWLDAMTPTIYERIDELVEKVAMTLNKKVDLTRSGKKASAEYKLISKVPQVRDVFYGRDNAIEEIENIFLSGNRVMFLEGMGGIGKSEIAKQYALKHKDEYENIIFVTYGDNLKRLVCDPTAIEISGVERGTQTDDEYYENKMRILRSVCDEKTLIIVDNFDVDSDENLSDFLEGSHRVIFTTRNSHRGYPCIKIGPIADEDILFKIFEDNYGDTVSDDDNEWLKKIFELVENHTYMIELIAKQMDASFLSAEEMYELITNGKFKTDLTESVPGRKEQKTAFEHLSSLFSISNLSDEEKYVLEILSVIGIKGVPVKRFREWSGISDMDIVNKLIHKSWVRKESGQRISLHPLMAEVVREKLKPDLTGIADCLKNMASFAHHAWFRAYGENIEVADNIYSVLKYFCPFDAKGTNRFEPMISFLWQVGRFDDSIEFDKCLYDACIKEYGESSMATGFVAKSLAGCYFNSRREQDSVKWYEQGLNCMLKSNCGDNEDLAMAYSKVARCYTWPFNLNREKAEEYFDIALKMRLRLKDVLCDEKATPPEWFNLYRKYNLEIAETRIAENYMEMGRMYQQFGDYAKALEYAEKYEEAMRGFSENDSSGYAYALYDIGVCKLNIGLEKKKASPCEAEADFAEAEEKLLAALKINLKMRGELANDTIDNQEILGDLYASTERYGDASNAYMAVISMLEKLYGPECEGIERVKEKMKFEL